MQRGDIGIGRTRLAKKKGAAAKGKERGNTDGDTIETNAEQKSQDRNHRKTIK